MQAANLLALKSVWTAPLTARVLSPQGISTAVWLDRIDAIKGGSVNGGRLGLTGHLDAALTQVWYDVRLIFTPCGDMQSSCHGHSR